VASLARLGLFFGSDEMTTETNVPALACFGIAIASFWLWCRLMISEYQNSKGEDEEQ